MTCYPADIGGAPVDVAIVVIKHILVGHRSLQHIAAGSVQDTLWLAGGPGGVKNEQGIFTAHVYRLTIR